MFSITWHQRPVCDDRYKKLSVLESGTAPATTVSTPVCTTWCYNWVSISSTTPHPDSTLSRLNTPSDIISLNVFLKFIDLRTIKSCFRIILQLLFCCSPVVRSENLNLEQNYGLVLSTLDIFESINVQRAFWKCIGISKSLVLLFSKTVWKYISFAFAYTFYFFSFSCFKSNFLSGTQQCYATVLSYVCKDETFSTFCHILFTFCSSWPMRLGFDRHTWKGQERAERKQS